jgi:hypothetical protein
LTRFAKRYYLITFQKRNNMATSKQLTFQFTEANATSSQVDSLASHTAQQESDLEKMMTDTSGRRCLERFGKFSRHGLLARTFAALLIGTGAWYSTKCRLTWKLSATKCNRLYFQLAPSTLPTDGIGFGLLPTVLVKNNENRQSEGYGPNLGMALKLLPTPEANNYKNGHKTVSPRIERKLEQGWTVGLNDRATLGLLPTPTAISDPKGGCTRPDAKRQNDTLAHAMHAQTNAQPGTTSQLNPRFVGEMMGFPKDWTVLPFLSGETNP